MPRNPMRSSSSGRRKLKYGASGSRRMQPLGRRRTGRRCRRQLPMTRRSGSHCWMTPAALTLPAATCTCSGHARGTPYPSTSARPPTSSRGSAPILDPPPGAPRWDGSPWCAAPARRRCSPARPRSYESSARSWNADRSPSVAVEAERGSDHSRYRPGRLDALSNAGDGLEDRSPPQEDRTMTVPGRHRGPAGSRTPGADDLPRRVPLRPDLAGRPGPVRRADPARPVGPGPGHPRGARRVRPGQARHRRP